MTMLDRMRRHKNWLKWSLALVCLTFVVFYIPDFLQPDSSIGAGTGLVGQNETIARVDGREISAGDFRRTYAAQLQMYRGAYGANINEQMLRQLGIEQQILQQMIDERAALAEAERLGLSVSDEEVRERIMSLPGLQENGRFIGEQRYRQLLRMQSPPMTPAEFEEGLRRSLLVERLRSALTDWMTLAEGEAEAEYRVRNEKVKLDVVTVTPDAFRPQVVVTDADVSRQFESNKEQYRIGEKRKIRYLLLDVESMRAKAGVAPADVERAYNDSIAQYSTPEQIRASHILLKTEGKDEASVRARAEELLKQVRAGADIAELARRHSEDEGSAPQGGDLDYFGRGRMVPEFEQAAFEAPAGAIVGPVKTPFGFHVIKIVDKKPATTRSLDEVRQQITDQLTSERAQTQLAALSAAVEKELTSPADLDRVAKARGLTVQETGFFARDEPVMGLGPAPEVNARAFEMKEGEMSGAVRAARGEVFLTLAGRQEARAAEPGRGARPCPRGRHAREGDGSRAREGRHDCDSPQDCSRFSEGRPGRWSRIAVDGAHRSGIGDSWGGTEPRHRPRRLLAQTRLGQRPDCDRQRGSHCEGGRTQGCDAGRVRCRPRAVPERAAQRSPHALFQRLHGEGEGAHEDRGRPEYPAAHARRGLSQPTTPPQRARTASAPAVRRAETAAAWTRP